MKIPTYSARYLDTNETIYERQPAGNLIGRLPLGSYPVRKIPDHYYDSTLERTDGGDPWEHALFMSDGSHRPIAITRDEATEFHLRIVVGVDWDNGTVTVLSNWADCPMEIMDLSEDHPELSMKADWHKAKEELHEIDSLP